MTRVLVLRPEPGASATLNRALERGLEAISAPLFEVEPVIWKAPALEAFDGLLLTSANAIRHGGDQLQRLKQLKVYAVGQTTAAAARCAGFDVIHVGSSGVDQLLASIEGNLKLLHLSGADRLESGNPRQQIVRIIVYRAKAVETIDLTCASGSVALIHSPRAGRRLAKLVRDKMNISIAAISPAAANAAGTGWKAVESADEPTDDALLALAARLCNNPQPK